MVKSIDHIELIVKEVEPYVQLFLKLGFQLLRRTQHHGESVELKLPGENQPIFEIHRVSGEENIGVNHIAFQVDDAPQAYESLKKQGVSFEEGPTFVSATGRIVVNFRDPDGWRLQLADVKRKSLQ
jgi:catechol 2,3-dioxygenase-like lactoylglutathione lyase family enzyme